MSDRPSDDQLRDIARNASSNWRYSGGVRALRAVWDAAKADLPDRETIARAIDPAIYPDVNRLTGDGWAAALRAADAVLALLRGERDK